MGALAGVVAGVAVGAAAQTVTGIGLVLVCGPVLVLLLREGEAVRVALVTSLALDAVLGASARSRPVAPRDAVERACGRCGDTPGNTGASH